MHGLGKRRGRRARNSSRSGGGCAYGEALERRLLFAGVTLTGSSGADVIEIQKTPGGNVVGKLNFTELFNVPDNDIDSILVNALGGGDTIYIDQTGTGNLVSVVGGEGSDSLLLADLGSTLSGNIQSNIEFVGGNGANTIVIDDDANLNPSTHEFTVGSYTVPSLFTLEWSGVGSVTLNAGGGDDTINFGNGGADTEISAFGNGGADTFDVGSFGSVELLLSPLTLDGGVGDDSLVYRDDSDFVEDFTVTATTIGRDFAAQAGYSDVEHVELVPGPALNRISVLSTSAAAEYIVDTINGGGVITLGDGGNMDSIEGNFLCTGFGVLNYDDAANPFSDAYTITDSTITRPFSAVVTYIGFAEVNVYCGAGFNDVDVNSAYPFTTYLIDGGLGTDSIRVHGTAAAADVVAFTPGVVEFQAQLGYEAVERFGFDGGGPGAASDQLQITADVTVDLLATAKLNGLTITSGRLDMNVHDLLFNYTGASPIGSWDGVAYTDITGLVASGHAGGAWDGDGLITTTSDAASGLTTLGVGEAADVLGLGGGDTANWDGFTIDATTVIVKYTYAGDANLDGFVSGDDYASIDGNVTVAGAFGWYNGDFNYDGIVSGDDYASIDSNIVAQGDPL